MPPKEVHLPVALGAVLAGRYRVERVIGVGGMGVVAAATHLQLDQPVAIKFLQPDALSSPDVVARFMREARAAVRIKSEHVARVLDVGALESGAPYMVMERLEGSDLAALLRAKGRLSIDIAIDYTLQALEAIAEAHSLGIVHRDLKPANLFLVSGRRSEKIKVLDFGISKTISSSGSAGSGMTQTSAVFGTPAYMSPEQLNSARDVDARGDVWSIGVILYELLAGETPFRADTIPQLCVAIMNHPMPALRVIRNDVPAALEAVIQRCLKKDRTERFSSAEDLAFALAEFAPPRARASIDRLRRHEVLSEPQLSDGAGATATAPGHLRPFPPGHGEMVPPSTQSEWGGTARGLGGRPRRWLWAAGLGGVTLTLIGIAAARFGVGRDVPESESRPGAELESAPAPSAARSPLAQPAPEAVATTDLGHPSVVATATASDAAAGSAMVLQPVSGSRKSFPDKGVRSGKAPAGVATRIPPASSARASERRPGSSEGWEDER
jgi:serine/threonine-protein kinase